MATFPLTPHTFEVVDTLDGDFQLVWEFRGRLWWYRHDGTVWHAPAGGDYSGEGTAGMTRARKRLDLDGILSRRAIHRRVIAYLVDHHRAVVA